MPAAGYRYAYSDDPIEPEQTKPRKSGFAFIALIVILMFVTFRYVYAGNISLGSGAAEFGQGLSATAACSGNTVISIAPQSAFSNVANGGSYLLSGLTVSGIPSGCTGDALTFRAYADSSNVPLAIYGSTATSFEVTSTGSSFTTSNSNLTLSQLSASGFTVNFTTPVAASTDVKKFTIQSAVDNNYSGRGSISFGASDSLAFNIASAIGTGPFTAEGWFRFTSAPTSNALLVGSSDGLGLYVNSALTQLRIVKWGSGTGDQIFYMNALSLNTWYHLAVARDGSSNTQLFIDGAKSINTQITDSNNYSGLPMTLASTGAGGKFVGLISNFRISNTAIYNPTGSTITTPVSPLTASASTLFLLNTRTDAPFIDSSPSAVTVTLNGSPTSVSTNPFG